MTEKMIAKQKQDERDLENSKILKELKKKATKELETKHKEMKEKI